jgi:Dynein heavy chain AAA lid domain
VPWDDLVYIFGEIMYGGHIVEDWDRRLANAYLARYFSESLLEGAEFFPGFSGPPSTMSHKQVRAPTSGLVLFCAPERMPAAFAAMRTLRCTHSSSLRDEAAQTLTLRDA